ncbi:YopT-type cysteine protease domain-containing protein [Rahnella inusitata]|uniref:Peptidase C58 YopT-type domain-containing protein n=1 Tax=Rahnella inusitata TaxID=58169 RepID=A0ABX9NXV0_9GAMM|nr:YopT-type cysteine protease domain-containing protein [Rahnella inusitata]QUT15266.1 hypothetical protein I2123_21945 [Rahnella inusitata]RJT11389.1 hypothetical protein D5396_16340 [Rahnella inusitata]
MQSDILIALLALNGDYHFFKQDDYITRNHWSDEDPTKRQGSWTGNQYDEHGKVIAYGNGAGVCEGLVAAYMISGKSWSNFQSYVASASGKNLIRGLTNLQWISPKVRSANGIKKSDIREDILKAHHVIYLNAATLPASAMYENGGAGVFDNIDPSICYMIAMCSGQSGHAISMRFNDGRIRLFDPNYGEFSFAYVNKKSKGMSIFISFLLNVYYPGKYTTFIIESYMPTRK